MSWSLLAHTGKGSSDSLSVTTSGIDTTGADLIIISVSWYKAGGSNPTISDSKGNTWTPLTLHQISSSISSRLYYCYSPTVGSGHTFTASGGLNYPTLTVAAFSGSAASPFDQENGATNATASTLATGSVTPTTDGQLIVSGFTVNAYNPSSVDSGLTTTDIVNYGLDAHMGGALAYYVQPTAGAINPTWTASGTNLVAASIATFKVAAGGTTTSAAGACIDLTVARAPGACIKPSPGRTVTLTDGHATGARILSAPGRTVDLTVARAVATITESAPGRCVALSVVYGSIATGTIQSRTGVTTALSIVSGSGADIRAGSGRTVTLTVARSPGAALIPVSGRTVDLTAARGVGSITLAGAGAIRTLTVARAVAAKLAASPGRIVCLTTARGSTDTSTVESRSASSVTLSVVYSIPAVPPYVWTRELISEATMRARAAYRLEVFDNEDFEIFGTIRTLTTLAGASLRFIGWDAEGNVAWDSDATPPTATCSVTDAAARTYDATTTPKAANSDGTPAVYRWQIQITNPGQVCDPLWGYLIVSARNAPITDALREELIGDRSS